MIDTNTTGPTIPASDAKQKRTPAGLILTFALLFLVAFQTVKMNKLASFDISASSTSIAVQTTAKTVTASKALPTNGKATKRTKMSLDELTNSSVAMDGCNVSWWIANKLDPPIRNWTQRIPLLVHQTSRFRCVPELMASTASIWRDLPQYQYYFHDDVSIWRLLHLDWPEFPHLHQAINCLKGMTSVTDIWRLILLWEYGGIYVDIDSAPNTWTPASIRPDDDAYFVVEFYDAPSQYFMAARPRHPLIFYAIHLALAKILGTPSNIKLDASQTTGPMALLHGLETFMSDAGQTVRKPVRAGLYRGLNNYTLRIEGRGRYDSDEIITREAIKRMKKIEMYSLMNMSHFIDELRDGRKRFRAGVLGRSCQAVAYDFQIGPPDWYLAKEHEDRTTLNGVTR